MIKRIHSLILQGVELYPSGWKCFLNDFELLGITPEALARQMEGQLMLVYTGDWTAEVRMSRCPWCTMKNYHITRVDGQTHFDNLEEHINKVHGKTLIDIKAYKFQIELYKEKLRLLRAGVIDHTYFVYTNWDCQFCDNVRKRGRGLCAVPESARNKVRSLVRMGFTAKNFNMNFLDRRNLGYIIGRPL